MIAVEDVAYVRYSAPDLDVMERFLLDFGMHRAERTSDALYMRGAGGNPYLHVTERGSASKGLGFGMVTASAADLRRLAAENGARVEDNPLPGGGLCVRLTDPAGFDVWIHHGLRQVPVASTRKPFRLVNVAVERGRCGELIRPGAGPSTVYRLGHVVLQCPDTAPSCRFYSDVLGLKVSDAYFSGTPENVVGRFMRCGLGERFSDHHSVGLFNSAKTRIGHSAFEVLDFDDLMRGNNHLLHRGYQHSWGVGRHVEGSQIFDYWRDPYGNKIEHWTDGDQVNDRYQGGVMPISIEGLSQWAPTMPANFFD